MYTLTIGKKNNAFKGRVKLIPQIVSSAHVSLKCPHNVISREANNKPNAGQQLKMVQTNCYFIPIHLCDDNFWSIELQIFKNGTQLGIFENNNNIIFV